MTDRELKDLREEISKLRERIAVLEQARQVQPVQFPFTRPGPPTWPNWVVPTVTC